MTTPPRHSWLNTIVGMIDTAFRLSDEELFFVTEVTKKLLEGLRIPERSHPNAIPAAVAAEAESGMFALQIHEPRSAGVVRRPHRRSVKDVSVTLEAWRQALLGLLVDAYPDLTGTEILVAASTFDEMLGALGVDDRTSAFLPDEVLRAHLMGA